MGFDTPDVTVVLSTHNRCELLGRALESLLSQRAGGVQYEVVVVDNNSGDRTHEVVAGLQARGHRNLRYLFEPRQGVSYGRNLGIVSSRAPLIAITDDDVQVEEDWIAAIRRVFDAHPEVDCIGGRILPRWPSPPPSWLTVHHHGPLALQDRGEAEIRVDVSHYLMLPTANVAFRRRVFERIGLFSPEFPRSQDRELELRLWRAGGVGLYTPALVARANVQPERLTKRFHRQWHGRTGHFWALTRMNEALDRDGGLLEHPPGGRSLFGVSGYVYRKLIRAAVAFCVATLRGREDLAFMQENRVRHLVSYIRTRTRLNAAGRKARSCAAALPSSIGRRESERGMTP